MLKKVVKVFECQNGDILADDITSKLGTAIVVKDSIMNEYMIQRLQDIGVKSVCIYQSNDKYQDSVSTGYKDFNNEYYKSLKTIRQVIKNLAAGKNLDLQKIESVSNTLYEQVMHDTNITLHLTKLRNYDESTYSHCLNVSIYAALLGKWLNLNMSQMKNLIQAGILHDIGKTKISKNILNKKGSLLPCEYEIIKNHTILGYNMVQNIDAISDEVKKAILLHHERANGSGYPFGYTLENLNLFSKAIAIVDVYDATISDRVYKCRSTPFEAFEWFLGPGLSLFDVSLINLFCRNISCSYIGAGIVLNNGAFGEIVHIPPHDISKPIIKVHTSYIDLSKQTDSNITRLI